MKVPLVVRGRLKTESRIATVGESTTNASFLINFYLVEHFTDDLLIYLVSALPISMRIMRLLTDIIDALVWLNSRPVCVSCAPHGDRPASGQIPPGSLWALSSDVNFSLKMTIVFCALASGSANSSHFEGVSLVIV